MSFASELISFLQFNPENCQEIINIFIFGENGNKNTKYLNHLDLKKYKLCKDLDINCCICCEKVKKSEYIRELNCNHLFHKKCIDKWLLYSMKYKESVKCPICRQLINLLT